jgi:hypothetical protein
MEIRLARREDHNAIWRIIEPTIRAGETYALPLDMGEQEALVYWTGPDRETFVAEQEDGRIVGTYYLRANQLVLRVSHMIQPIRVGTSRRAVSSRSAANHLSDSVH